MVHYRYLYFADEGETKQQERKHAHIYTHRQYKDYLKNLMKNRLELSIKREKKWLIIKTVLA